MRTLAILTLLLIMSILHSNAQEPKEAISKRINLSGYFGAGVSYFGISNTIYSQPYESLEFRSGLLIDRPLNKTFSLNSGLILGMKLKRKSEFNSSPVNVSNYRLDKTTSSRAHFVFEIPITMQVNVSREFVRMEVGVNTRFWFPNNRNVDLLTAKSEFGIVLGLNKNVSKNVNLGAEFYSGLTNIYSYTEYSKSPITQESEVTNRYMQLTVEYSF